MKPNFDQMPTDDLRAYVRRNHDDWEALDILVSRRTPDSEATWYAPMVTAEGVPIEENIQLAAKGIQERVTLEGKKESIRREIEAHEALYKGMMKADAEWREEKKKINQ
ncbi:DUF6887 family protein [Dolichospermum heterosporum]|uniref:Uncharacterized protein n=1 Tax=Dolichospermum heterosporum TAC447 TaxID=747523 RepID=A0ABY5M1U9_9CYAN|nr:hypothetical protein [Dolichospermum heterosporum]UUO17037.1 hypothetical protein NG743_08520 [Dolichospermum heterosporum TAC447]